VVAATWWYTGSSPRARGTLAKQAEEIDKERFIPARAGNTRPRAKASTPCSVHPRARGEHYVFHLTKNNDYGSSPRARGTLRLAILQLLHRRFIPARAGNTTPAPRRQRPTSVHPRARGEHVSCCGARGY